MVHVDDKGNLFGEPQPPLACHGPCGVIGIKLVAVKPKAIQQRQFKQRAITKAYKKAYTRHIKGLQKPYEKAYLKDKAYKSHIKSK